MFEHIGKSGPQPQDASVTLPAGIAPDGGQNPTADTSSNSNIATVATDDIPMSMDETDKLVPVTVPAVVALVVPKPSGAPRRQMRGAKRAAEDHEDDITHKYLQLLHDAPDAPPALVDGPPSTSIASAVAVMPASIATPAADWNFMPGSDIDVYVELVENIAARREPGIPVDANVSRMRWISQNASKIHWAAGVLGEELLSTIEGIWKTTQFMGV